MNAIRRHPFFTAWIACCLVLIVAGVGWGLRLRKNIRSELAGVDKKTRQRAQWQKEVQLVDAELEVPTPDQPATVVALPTEERAMIPRKPLDGFIAIAGAVEKMCRLAASESVAISPDESFGFSSYAHVGPSENEMLAVYEQLGLTRLLVEKLLAAHPVRLFAVRRERPHPKGEEGPGESPADFFQLDRRLDLRVPGSIEGWAVRLEFTGRSSVLWSFLQSLTSSPEPLLVRSVEVEPLTEGGKRQESGSKVSVVLLRANVNGAISPRLEVSQRPTGAARVGSDYALFDPPSLNRRTSQLINALAQTESGGNLATPPMELLAVKREPYRLQLVGYYGVAGDYTATFVSPGSPATLFAREGDRFESLGLVLKNFSIKKRATESPGGRSGFELTACALLWDERAQTKVTLVGSTPLMTDTLVALLRPGPSSVQPGEFRTGDTFREGKAICRIERIQLDPAEVVIARELPGQASPEKLILRPVAPVSGALSSAGRSP